MDLAAKVGHFILVPHDPAGTTVDTRGPTQPSQVGAQGSRDNTGTTANVLRWLRRRKDAAGQPLLTAVQVDAGERLAADFVRGQMMPRVTADWSHTGAQLPKRRGVPGYKVELSVGITAAQERFRAAIGIVGPEFADLLINVCCFDIGLEEIEARQGWPKRTGKVLLRVALNHLARHYGLIQPAPAEGHIRHAGAAGYRPDVGP
jgi:Domain of unknown function (DUF6456)